MTRCTIGGICLGTGLNQGRVLGREAVIGLTTSATATSSDQQKNQDKKQRVCAAFRRHQERPCQHASIPSRLPMLRVSGEKRSTQDNLLLQQIREPRRLREVNSRSAGGGADDLAEVFLTGLYAQLRVQRRSRRC